MGQTIPRQHPAVVLRSQYRQLRTLLVVAMIAVIGLTAAVVILATNDAPTSRGLASPAGATGQAMAAGRGDGGPEESNVAAAVGSQPTAVGPDESTIAATIGSASKRASVPARPDESRVAAAISGRSADHRR
jgi:hypothetical protein